MQQIREVMTDDVVVVSSSSSLADAGRTMRDNGIGDVIVVDDGRFLGLVTDRDIVVRAVADGSDPTTSKVGDVMSKDIVTLTPDATVDEAVQVMRDAAVRRVPVLDGDRPVGIVSIGDLAIREDRDSALADISDTPPNS